jgi:RimJ/RimL family protein N-acetyltransferase
MNLSQFKSNLREESLKLKPGDQFSAELIAMGEWVLQEPEVLKQLWVWRKIYKEGFFYESEPSFDSFCSFLLKGAIFSGDRILFLMYEFDVALGHLGLVVRQDGVGEIDNVLRGESQTRSSGRGSIMESALRSMVSWANLSLGLSVFELQVRSDNARALSLYHRCGFVEVGRKSMNYSEGLDGVVLIEAEGQESEANVKKIIMRHTIAE